MKSITSISEAQQAINELYNRIDTLSVKNWDRRQTRIVNAHPSVDPYDYVVRKELDAIKGGSEVVGVTGDTEVHVFGVSGAVSVVTNGFPPLIFEHSVSLIALHTCFNVAPTGTDFHADIRLRSTGLSILNSQIVIPASSTAVVEYTSFALSSFAKDDVLLCDVTQVGSGVPGSMWAAYMLFKVK